MQVVKNHNGKYNLLISLKNKMHICASAGKVLEFESLADASEIAKILKRNLGGSDAR
jgi:hypothetical protein